MRGAEGIQREDEEDVAEAFRVEDFPGLFGIGLVVPLKIKRIVYRYLPTYVVSLLIK